MLPSSVDDATAEVVVRVVYDGPDLDDVARAIGASPDEVAALHAAARYRVAFLGFLPGFGSASRLAGIISKARALEMILSGEAIQAKEALRIGLVNRVPDKSEELLTVSLTLAEQICRNAPLAVKYAIETINHGGRLSLEDGLRLESAFFGLCFATRDVEEGTKAFLEKRPPVFTGQ